MTYDLNRAINLATEDALVDLEREDLTDIKNNHAKSIIASHAQDVVPMYEGTLLEVYINHRRELMAYEPGIPMQENTRATRNPYINERGLRTAIHCLVFDRIQENLNDIIDAE